MNQIESEHSHLRCSLWTALVTPFEPSGQIDFNSLKHIAVKQAKAGNGILLLGSTGEGLALNPQEQLKVVKFVSSLSLPVPLMVAVGGYQLTEQLNWVDQCNELSIDAFLLAAPVYAKPGPIGQKHWFEALLNQAKHPCMLYNVPSRSGVELLPEVLSELQNHENCWALKEASGDITKFLAFRHACSKLELFSGEDGLMPYLATAGAKGLVSVCANVWPQATQAYVNLCLSGDVDGLFPLWYQATQSLFSVSNPVPAKILMSLNKDLASATLRPPLAEAELTSLNELEIAHQNITRWHQSLAVNSAA